MNSRRYIIDEIPELSTWLELINCNLDKDVEPLSEAEIVKLTMLEKGEMLPLGHCEVRRVI
tara:strand:+ start:380 stop:562 length:183 start_codon:yes stop_codon:yes gene_type:complete